jgi:hypothetical protein
MNPQLEAFTLLLQAAAPGLHPALVRSLLRAYLRLGAVSRPAHRHGHDPHRRSPRPVSPRCLPPVPAGRGLEHGPPYVRSSLEVDVHGLR